MKKSICVFASRNEKPDLYINIIGYCIAKFESPNISSIHLLKIIDNPLEKETEQEKLEYLKNNIKTQLRSLTEGKYNSWNWELNSFKEIGRPKDIEISEQYKRIYKTVLLTVETVDIDIQVLLNDDVEIEIEKIVEEKPQDFIFDVTGVITRHLIRLSLSLLAYNKSIYAFEMNKKLTHTEADLIHSLTRQDFEYCLLNITRFSVFGEKQKSTINKPSGKKKISKNILINQLAAAETEQVLAELLNNQNLEDFVTEIVGISARYNHEKKAWHQGVIDRDSFGKGLNQINQAIIELINKIDK
jgi:hypothetical protein